MTQLFWLSKHLKSDEPEYSVDHLDFIEFQEFLCRLSMMIYPTPRQSDDTQEVEIQMTCASPLSAKVYALLKDQLLPTVGYQNEIKGEGPKFDNRARKAHMRKR